MRAAEKSSSNFCAVVVPWRQHDLPLDGEPDPSGIPLLSTVPLFLPVFFTLFPPIFSTPQFSPLFELDTQAILFLPALRAGPPSQHIFWLIEPRSTHRQSQRNWHLR